MSAPIQPDYLRFNDLMTVLASKMQMLASSVAQLAAPDPNAARVRIIRQAGVQIPRLLVQHTFAAAGDANAIVSGPIVVKGINFSSVTPGVVTLYDGLTVAGGTLVATWNPGAAGIAYLDYPFAVGLSVHATQPGQLSLSYELGNG